MSSSEQCRRGRPHHNVLGPMQGRVLDVTYTDASDLYHQPKPTWVAAALMEWTLKK